jgi:hypothetical protein
MELTGMVVESDDRVPAKGSRPESQGIGEKEDQRQENITTHAGRSYRSPFV